MTRDRVVDDASLLETLLITVEPSCGSYFIHYLIHYASLGNAAVFLRWESSRKKLFMEEKALHEGTICKEKADV
jgi:hypothetical protein